MGYYQGDPFFGAALPALGKLVPKVLPSLGRIAGKIGGAIGRKGGIVKSAGKIAAGGAVFEAGSRAAGRVFGGGERRRYRRMNVTNVKALRRAIRRAKGFSKLARSVVTFVERKPARGKPFFKSRKRR